MSSLTTPRHPARNQTIIVLDDDMNVYSEWHTHAPNDPNAPRCWNCNKYQTKLRRLSEMPVYHEDTGLTTLEMGCGRCSEREQDKRDSAARRIERQCKTTVAKNKEYANRRRYNTSLVHHAVKEVKESQVGYRVVVNESSKDNIPDTATSVETVVVPATATVPATVPATATATATATELQKFFASQMEAMLRKQADLEAELARLRNPPTGQPAGVPQGPVQQAQGAEAQVTTGPRSKRVINDDDNDVVMQTGETTDDQRAQDAQVGQLSPFSQAVHELSAIDVTE